TAAFINDTLSVADIDAVVEQAHILADDWKAAASSLANSYDARSAMPSISPAAGYASSAFSASRWHPILDRARPHLGIDIAAPAGTTVLAAARGRVARVGWYGEYGLLIEIEHGHGYVTRYAHLRRALVTQGQL